MNTNNKKAIELLHELRDSVFEVTNSDLSRVIDLLQDNEDTGGKEKYCHRCLSDKPSSKVEKLKKLKYRSGIWDSKDPVYLDEFKQLIDILIEDKECR